MTWQTQAACLPQNPAGPTIAHWFDSHLDRETPTQRRDRHFIARSICKHCPVQQQCLDDALADPARDGIYAGYLLEIETR